MILSKEEAEKISDIVWKNLNSNESMKLILKKGINQYIAINTGQITLDIIDFIEKNYRDK